MNTTIRNPSIINAKRGKMGVLSLKGKTKIELYVTLNSFFGELANSIDGIYPFSITTK